ncbi:MAG TPA: fasciclin domain-containing protein [Methanotrichaceae archaeon]|nr:fasciclin domain-containing protein [Methanotrichaceae archaeon]
MNAKTVLFALLASAIFLSGVCISQDEDTAPEMDIYETIATDGNFTTLVTALQEAGLVETLKEPGPFTMCTPTDEAFSKIPEEELNDLLADENRLRDVLMYHIIPGAKVMSSDLVDGMTATTMQGENLTFDINETAVMVDGATVLEPDIEASNGVIYHIDTVMMPPM